MSFQHHASWTLDAVIPFQLPAASAAASASRAKSLRVVEAALHQRAHRLQPDDPGAVERLVQARGETLARLHLVVDRRGLPELEQVDEAPAVALEGQLELGGRLRVADDLVGDREQLADLVVAHAAPSDAR